MPDYCRHRVGFELVKTTISNGSTQVRMLCHQCRDVYGAAVSQDDIDLEALQAFEVKGLINPPCERCGSPYTELHHYMPQSLARKARLNPEEWATGYLCDDCHNTWHRIVTPGLVPDAERRWTEPKPERAK